MMLFNLFHKTGINNEVIIRNVHEEELYYGRFGDISMKLGYFEICKVVEKDGIMIIYIGRS